MKKLIISIFCVMLLLSGGCSRASTSSVTIDYGTSSIYSKKDMDDAVEVIKQQFSQFKGCDLHSLSYTTDEISTDSDNIAWMNELEEANDNKEIFTQCIAFDSSFHSPLHGGGTWRTNEEYTWMWWLARTDHGEWKLMTWGY